MTASLAARARYLYEQLCQRSAGLQERTMRRALVAAYLQRMDVETRTALLQQICLHSPTDTRAAQLLVAFQDQAEAHGVDADDLDAMLRYAQAAGHEQVQRLLCSLQERAPGANGLAGHPDLLDLPLGMRKALARKPDIKMLEKLLLDPHPAVIQQLLQNPRLTEREVLQIATRRPTKAAILEAVAQSPWFDRYRIKSALAQNPHTPVPIAFQALAFLRHQELRQIADDDQLDAGLTAAALFALHQRHAPPDHR